jgi:small subunit ribosomal protein S20
MANLKSAKKRIVQSIKRTEINKFRKSRIKSGIKRINDLLTSKKKDKVRSHFLEIESEVSRAVSKGIYKKNTASRIISSLSQRIKAAG